jgi:carbon monoxide dehydrogenase subunit G
LVASLEFQGTEELKVPRSVVFSKLCDPKVLAQSIPEASEVSVSQDGEISCNVKVRISLVQSSMKVKMKVLEASPETGVKVVSTATGAGSNAEVIATFKLSGAETTRVDWSATARLSGLMSGLGTSMLRNYASKLVDSVVTNLKSMIEQ